MSLSININCGRLKSKSYHENLLCNPPTLLCSNKEKYVENKTEELVQK